MITKESVAAIETSPELKEEITSLLNTIENQKTSFTELVEINKAVSRDNDRLRSEWELSKQQLHEMELMKDSIYSEKEILRSKLQSFGCRFGVNV